MEVRRGVRQRAAGAQGGAATARLGQRLPGRVGVALVSDPGGKAPGQAVGDDVRVALHGLLQERPLVAARVGQVAPLVLVGGLAAAPAEGVAAHLVLEDVQAGAKVGFELG